MNLVGAVRISTGVLLTLAGAAVLGVALLLTTGWLFHGRHVYNLAVGAFTVGGPRPVGFEILGAGEGCPDSHPVKVGLRNDGSRTLLRTNIEITATQPGHSSDLLNGRGDIADDTILAPGQSWERCYSFAAGPGAIYSAQITNASFD